MDSDEDQMTEVLNRVWLPEFPAVRKIFRPIIFLICVNPVHLRLISTIGYGFRPNKVGTLLKIPNFNLANLAQDNFYHGSIRLRNGLFALCLVCDARIGGIALRKLASLEIIENGYLRG